MHIDPPHTGFVAHYRSGELVFERNWYTDSQNRIRATNWSEVNLDQVIRLELRWQGEPRAILDLEDLEKHSEWIFFHTGIFDGKNNSIQSRSIGFMAGGEQYLATVDEKTGHLTNTSALLF